MCAPGTSAGPAELYQKPCSAGSAASRAERVEPAQERSARKVVGAGGGDMGVLMIGAPGAGKGTQGALIAAHFDIPRVLVGDLLRDHVAPRTDLGLARGWHPGRGEHG